jgi:K+-transporting ATPase ATPase C chain
MIKHVVISLKMLFLSTVVLGFGYTMIVTFIGAIFFHSKTAGSFIQYKGEIVGSKLIGQKFEDPRLFWSRPSASDYATLPSSATNYGPINKTLKTDVEKRMSLLQQYAPTTNYENAPTDFLFASASGIDPHISLLNAQHQALRIKKALNLNNNEYNRLTELIHSQVESSDLGFLGKKRINVLLLNIKLKQAFNIQMGSDNAKRHE